MIDLKELSDSLAGKVRGNPVAISLFKEEIPKPYEQKKVVPCSIVRHAMDKGEIVSFDRHHHDCTTGVYTAGVHEGTDEIRNGQYLAQNIPAYTDVGAEKIKTGEYVLPQKTVVGIGAAPLSDVPDDIFVDWIVVVCTPHWATLLEVQGLYWMAPRQEELLALLFVAIFLQPPGMTATLSLLLVIWEEE